MFNPNIGLFGYFSKFQAYARRYGFLQAAKRSIEKLKEKGWIGTTGLQLSSIKYGKASASNRIGVLSFQCNICGKICESKITDLKREKPSCTRCGSTVRMRANIHVLSMELFGENLVIGDFPQRPDIVGIGISDWEGYAVPLAHKLGYKNTYYHKDPKLDITSIDPALEGRLDFIISSDVFEHVSPPVSIAFENAQKLLKPGGVLIFSVPYTKNGTTIEHFPDLYKYEIIKKGNGHILKNITRDGTEQIFNNLVFHGGAGATLEMRLFSEYSLGEEFAKAGFNCVKFYRDPDFDHGIYWLHDWSLPIAARAKENT
jgi:SAM-dependent methyltransferase